MILRVAIWQCESLVEFSTSRNHDRLLRMREGPEVMKTLLPSLLVRGTTFACQEADLQEEALREAVLREAVFRVMALNVHSPRVRPQMDLGEERSEAESGSSERSRIDEKRQTELLSENYLPSDQRTPG